MDIPGIDPFVWRFGSLGVRWYGLFMAISIAVGIWYLVRAGRQRHLSEDFLFNLSLVAVVGGILGARLVYVLTNLDFYLLHPAQIIRIDMGGLSFHGALLGGALAGWWYAARNRVPLAPLLDLAVPGVATGIALVRIGNIFNREILGYPAVILGGARHPAQLYGSAIGVVLLLLFWRQTRQDPPDGYRFWTAVIWYSILRFVNEFFRVQNPHFLIDYVNPYLGIGAVTLTQWLTPLFLVVAWLYRRKALQADRRWHAPKDSPVYEPPPKS